MPKSKTQFSDALRKQQSKKPKQQSKQRNKQTMSGAKQQNRQFIPVPQKTFVMKAPQEKRPSRRGGFRVAHREFMGTLVAGSTGNWAVASILTPAGTTVPARFRVNPASEGTFAWLNPMGRCFERFVFHKCTFILLPKVSFNNSGDNLITPDYDAEDGAPFSEQIATNNINTVSGPILQELRCSLPKARLNRAYASHYCMSDARFATTSQDTKTIDPAQVIFSGENALSQGTSYAKLWVEYDVEFDSPQSVTEAMNQSGMVQAQTTSGSGFSAPTFGVQQAQSLVTSLNNNANTNLLQFNRPWSGNLTSVFTSTGALNPATYFPLKNGASFPNANTGPGSFTYSPVTSTAVGAGGGSSFRIDPVSFNAGDILSYTATLPSVASGLNVYLGGSSAGLTPTII